MVQVCIIFPSDCIQPVLKLTSFVNSLLGLLHVIQVQEEFWWTAVACDSANVLCKDVLAVCEQGKQSCILQLQPVRQCLQALTDCCAFPLIALPKYCRWGDLS